MLAYLAITITAAIRTEEAHLTEKFGGAYPAYRERRARPPGAGVQPERALRNREYRALPGSRSSCVLLVVRCPVSACALRLAGSAVAIIGVRAVRSVVPGG